MLFCVGAFFGDDTPAGALPVGLPLPTYVLGPVTPAQAPHFAAHAGGGDLADNLTYLGACGARGRPHHVARLPSAGAGAVGAARLAEGFFYDAAPAGPAGHHVLTGGPGRRQARAASSPRRRACAWRT
jgi:hypothetical protein